MLKRVIAAMIAIVLTAAAAFLVVNYASNADARALEGMETDNVYVAAAAIPEGTTAEELGTFVDTQAIPKQFQVAGRVTDLSDLEGRVVTAAISEGEQLQLGRFATPEEVRARGTFTLPEEAETYHQLTIPLENPRALGGSIVAGDRVGVFGSFDIETEHNYVLDDDGNIVFDERAQQEESADSGTGGEDGSSEDEGESFTITDLLLHKVLVVRVEGGFVAPPSNARDEDAEAQAPADTIHVTLALPAEDAARVIYAKEYGSVWLTLEPEGADDDDARTIVITVPSTGRNVLE
ncbi:Flp pilus assembly protein CpaB [Ornithinimicrobium pekingense]|uniref:SAF domain-containing protein n=1 Tax=Ornithinimicrobium pekingense TaxID=384677 RepID=A0ABQ2F7E3_9MICO|nr:Flp pilus assembly protein CpaB [Ornithinimicrobium pekingense]GGK68661.1 hypothetical protein GCM10011509_16350 [Ornithinimicrobium pekingense]